MAPRQKKADELKAKEARQKKLLAVLVVVLAALMAIQGPKLLKSGAPQAATPPPPTTTATAPAGTPTTLDPPTTGGGASTPTLPGSGATAGAASGSTSSLVDAGALPVAGDGQLVRFDLFSSKDPFVQQVQADSPPDSDDGAVEPDDAGAAPPDTAPPSPSGGDGFGGTPSGGGSGSGSGSSTGSGADGTVAVASITVDGKNELVAVDRDFPVADPVFHLVSLTASTATISVVGGSYASGAGTLTLQKGKTVTLENTADGTRYRLLYVGRKQVAPSALPAAPQTETAPATTVPAATTPTPTTTTTTP